MKNKQRRGNPVLLIAILILVLVFIVSGLQLLESAFSDHNEEDYGPRKTIIRDGVEYFPRQNVVTVLLAGIDEDGPAESSGAYNNNGEADMVTLLIFDKTNRKMDLIALNRDTMMEIPVLGVNGKDAGTVEGQLALAHTYGSGLADSGKNLSKAVSKFLYGVEIDYYVTMRMDAIAMLNDAVGGVEVEVTDDFSAVDPTIPMGKVKLNGQQALNFVRVRYGVGDQLNTSRMQRQETYMRGFVAALRKGIKESGSFVLDTYEQVKAYTVTNCSTKTMVTLSNQFADFELSAVVSPKGESIQGKQYMEFRVDEQELDRLILRYLYAPK